MFYKGKWIKTSEHPYAKRIHQYDEPFLYCLNTSEKVIEINGLTFADWDDLCGDTLKQFKEKTGIADNCDIHKFNERGYKRGHKIQLVY